jgi:HK97 family phage prohead protease
MNLLHKSFPLKIEIKEDPENPDARTVEGWASTFGNKDSYNDIILRGAFINSLKERMPRMLWQHDSDQPCGVWDSATETDQGLYVKGRILPTSLGNDVYELLKAGAIDSMSIGYTTVDASYDYDSGVRTLKELELWEVSLVTFPANEQARITNVKAMAEDIDAAHACLEQAAGICDAYMKGNMDPTKEAFGTVHDHIRSAQKMLREPDEPDQDDKSTKLPMTIRGLEKHLRDAGFTQKQAKGIAAEGFKAIAPQRDAAPQQATSELASIFRQFTC